MDEFVFYGTWEDTWAVLSEVLARKGTTLVADLEYHYPRPMIIRALTNQTKDLLRRRPRVYVWGEDFSHRPPCLVQQMTGPLAGKYFVYLAGGGPALELALPRSGADEGLHELDAGRLTYPAEFWNAERARWERPGVALKRAYEDVKDRVLAHVQRHLPVQDLWIGPHAWYLVREGKARVRVLSFPPVEAVKRM